jgi:hypothetical protein
MTSHHSIEPLESRCHLAAIAGVVWNDSDGSGVFDETETPIQSATVFLDANHNARLDSGERTALTDASGGYMFTGLAAGTYDVMQLLPSGFGQLTPGRTGSYESHFDIGIDYRSDFTAAESHAFEAAAQRWEALIVGDLPDVQTGIGLVDDVVIDVSIIDLDGVGGTLAQAAPTELRSNTSLPSRGELEVDRADIANLVAKGKLVSTLTHEIGHVLGFGTIWQQKGLIAGAGTGSPRFTGTNAKNAYNALFGTSATSVPLENTGGAATIETHWRESIFGDEQMTGFSEAAGVPEPLSSVTVAQFQDLGYTVNANFADQWDPASGDVQLWSPAETGVLPFARRVVVSSSETQSDIDFGLRANKAPIVSSFTISPSPAAAGQNITLSAVATDPDGDPLVGVTFYRESNGTPGVQSGSDTYVSTKFTSKRGTFSAETATDSLSGSQIYYAVAVDTMLFAGKRSAAVTIAAPPSRPSPLIATPQSASTTLLQWKDRSADEIGFRIEVSTSADFASILRAFNVRANSTSTLVSSLMSPVNYYYRIRAYNSAGASAYTRIGPITQNI